MKSIGKVSPVTEQDQTLLDNCEIFFKNLIKYHHHHPFLSPTQDLVPFGSRTLCSGQREFGLLLALLGAHDSGKKSQTSPKPQEGGFLSDPVEKRRSGVIAFQ